MNRPAGDRRASALLVLGVVVGVAAAAVGLLQSGGSVASMPDGMVASVNGELITAEAFRQLEEAVTAERRGAPLDEAQRQRIIDRLVDEELLLQRGLALGLARHEPTARRSIVSAVVATVTADAEATEPDEATLRKYHAEAKELFQRPGRVQAEVLFMSTSARAESQAFQRAAEAARRLRAGEPFATVSDELGDPQPTTLPAGPLPLETLREYLGPSPAQASIALAPGQVSDPVRGGAGYYVLRVVDRLGGDVAPLEEVRDQVRAEWLRTQGERALGDYLAELRAQAEVQVRLPAPSTSPASGRIAR